MFSDYSYTGKDFASVREEIMEYVKEHDPHYTDYNESSLQLQYFDILSGVCDLILYYLDNQALETYLSTARQEKNVKNILSTLNYFIDPVGPARGYVHIDRQIQEVGVRGVVDSYIEGRISIPKFTKIYSPDPTIPPYLTADEAFMTNEVMQVTVPVIQGELRQLAIPYDTVRESYKLYLSDRPLSLEWVEIEDEGWEKVDDAFLEIEGGPKYSVHVDSKDRTYILFTFNWKNFISDDPSGVMQIHYVDTLGREGLVDAHTLVCVGKGCKNIDTGEDMSKALICMNESKTIGAYDKPSINEHKANGRKWLQTYDRIITIQDFEVMLKKKDWIRTCYVADWRTNGTLVQYPHEGKAWVVTTDGANIEDNSVFLTLAKELQEKTTMMTSIEIKSAIFNTADWKIGIEVTGTSEEKKLKVREKVEQRLKDRYLLTEFCKGNPESKLAFNMEVRPSIIEAEIYNISDSIADVVLPFDEPFQLAENEFLNIESIEVYLI